MLPDDKRFGPVRIEAAIRIAKDYNDPSITPAVVMAASDLGLMPLEVSLMLDAWTESMAAVLAYRREQRKKAK